MIPSSFDKDANEARCGPASHGFPNRTTLPAAELAAGESERRSRAMMDALPAAIYTTDAAGYLTHFNPAAAELAGRQPTLGTDQWCISWKLYYPDGTPMPHAACPMALALKEGRIVRGVEAILERPDGQRIWFEPYPTLLRDSTGRIVAGINMLVDITERKRAEAVRAHLAAIVESSADAIISKSLQGIITSWNQGAEKIFGYTAAETVGQPITLLIPPQRMDEEPQILDSIQRGITVTHYETVRRCKDGTEIDISLTVSPIRDSSGTIIGASKIARDITERKRTEVALHHLNATLEQRVAERTTELARSNAELDRFAYVASHDLRAPLRAIDQLAKWITQDAAALLPEPSQVHLTKLRGRIKRMDGLLTDLLAYARAGRQHHTPERIDTGTLIRKLLDLLILPPGFTVNLVGALPLFVTERIPLETVLRNLIDNAIKHHHHPTTGCIDISAADQGPWIEFTVTDDGPGIDPAYHARIFAIFQTLQPRDQVEGSGMGLAIVQRLVESRGGTVQVDSHPGEGTTFRFTWPKAAASVSNA